MRPVERRQPRVSVQDLRRDLREADEDRYHLLIRTGDWRHTRVGVQEVRRQLREADEDRFRLTMRVRSLLRVIQRAGISACLMLVAGGALVIWNAKRADVPQVPVAHGVSAPAETAATDSELPAPVVVSQEPSGRVGPLGPPRTISAPAPRRPMNRQRQFAAPGGNSVATVQKTEPRATRIAPRPLHPGEFGRAL